MCRVSAHFCEAHLLPGWWIATRGLPAHVPPLTAGSFLPLHMRKMWDLYMIVSTMSDFILFIFFNISSMFTFSPVKLRQNTKFHCAERWCPKMKRNIGLVVLIGFLALAWWKKIGLSWESTCLRVCVKKSESQKLFFQNATLNLLKQKIHQPKPRILLFIINR